MKHYSGAALPSVARPSRQPELALVTEEEIIIEIAGRIRRHGEQGRVAMELGVSQSGLSNILTSGRGIGPRLATALGYRKVVRFERIE
jgi:hypothetical protein